MTSPVLVVGFGNLLAADDGVGLRVVECLQAAGMPAGMRAEIGDSDSLCLPQLWRGEPRVWLVDAVLAGGAPGSCRVLEHDQVLSLPQRHATAHQLSLPENLRWIALGHPEMAGVRYRLWGVEPETVQWRQQLSPRIAAAVPAVASMMLQAYAAE